MSKPKLSVEDFYHQFHGAHHHNDPNEYTKPGWYVTNPKLEQRQKGLNLKAFRNSKRKKKVVIHKGHDVMLLEMTRRRKAK